MIGDKTVTDIVVALEQGKIIATPTDTVWGFLVDGSNKQAVEKLYAVKARDISKQLILFTSGGKQLSQLVKDVPAYAERFMTAFWPGKLTLVLPTSKQIYAKQQTDTVGVRMPNMEHLLALLAETDIPILSTSANRAGEEVLQSGAAISAMFGDTVLVWEPRGIEATKALGTLPSTVVDCLEYNSWEILRAGAVPKEELWGILDRENNFV